MIFILLFVSFLGSSSYGKAPFPKDIPCFPQVSTFIDKLGFVEKWYAFPSGVGGEVSNFGSVEVHLQKKTSTIVARTHKNRIDVQYISPKCEQLVTQGKFLAKGHTDFELGKTLELYKSGFIYIWSPHMDLSVKELESLTKKKPTYPMTVILDPKADAESASAIAKNFNWPTEYLRPLDSASLLKMDITIHYPSIVIFKNGQLLKRVPGYSGISLDQILKNHLK